MTSGLQAGAPARVLADKVGLASAARFISARGRDGGGGRRCGGGDGWTFKVS